MTHTLPPSTAPEATPEKLADEIKQTTAICAHCEDEMACVFCGGREVAETVTLNEKRYLWLREKDLNTIDDGGVFAGLTPNKIVLNGSDLDAAVDAEIEAHIAENADYLKDGYE